MWSIELKLLSLVPIDITLSTVILYLASNNRLVGNNWKLGAGQSWGWETHAMLRSSWDLIVSDRVSSQYPSAGWVTLNLVWNKNTGINLGALADSEGLPQDSNRPQIYDHFLSITKNSFKLRNLLSEWIKAALDVDLRKLISVRVETLKSHKDKASSHNTNCDLLQSSLSHLHVEAWIEMEYWRREVCKSRPVQIFINKMWQNIT